MKKILFVFLICLTLQNCLTMISKVLLQGIDNQKNKGKNENCDIQTYVNYEGKHYTEKVLPYIAIPEMLAGLYGIYYFYPNGLKMYGAALYGLSVPLFLIPENGNPNSYDRYGNRLNVASVNWNQNKHSNCQNQTEFFSYSNQLKVEIDLTKKEYSQILGNNFSNQKIFESVCKNNQSSLEEDFYNRLFLLYEEEIIKIKSEGNRYGQSEEEAKSIEDRIIALNKKKFTRQQILSILKKENLKYEAFVESVNFEYPKTVTCSLTYYLQYTGRKDAFKKKMETYFEK